MKKQPFLHSFLYAVQGVRTALREERNLRFHVCTHFMCMCSACFMSSHAQNIALSP